MNQIARQPHLQLTQADARSVAIVCGDPERCFTFAKQCDAFKEVAFNREYRTLDCELDNERFLVVSHGVGSAGAAICFHELIKIGVKVIIRAGTAGSLQKEKYTQGNIVVCQAAVKEDGVSRLMEPQGIPAVADFGITQMLLKSAAKKGHKVSLGTTVSSDIFYPPTVVPGTLPTYRDAGIDIVEMEVSTLFVICRQNQVRTGAICVIDGCPFEWDTGDYDPTGQRLIIAKEKMGEIVLDSAVALSRECREAI